MNFVSLITGLSKLKEAMEAGQEVANPATWKNKSVTANKIALILSFVIVVAKTAGHDLPVDQETLETVAVGLAGLLSIFNIIVTLSTSKKVGI